MDTFEKPENFEIVQVLMQQMQIGRGVNMQGMNNKGGHIPKEGNN